MIQSRTNKETMWSNEKGPYPSQTSPSSQSSSLSNHEYKQHHHHRTIITIIAIVVLSITSSSSSSSSCDIIPIDEQSTCHTNTIGSTNNNVHHLFAHAFSPIIHHKRPASAAGLPIAKTIPSFAPSPRTTSTTTSIFNQSPQQHSSSNTTTTTTDEPPPMTTAPEINQWKTIMTTPPTPTPNTTPTLSGPHLQFMSPYDRVQMENYWDRIMPTVSYLGSQSSSNIKRALVVAYCAHRSQVRKSGEPFIIHPVEVGLLLAGLKMDEETVLAGLLHDTVEDTDLTFEEVEAMFGPVVRNLVEGETKVSKLPTLEFEDYADEQAENLRQMFMAMTDDWRIIIVKLADRLHNMRTLRYMKPEKQTKISKETLDIFAPLAHRMGIWQFKSELEDTAFMYLYPGEYKRLNRHLRRIQTRIRDTLETSQDILRKTMSRDATLTEQAVSVEVSGRRKELYSLWHKMETKGEDNLDQITDVVALRVIIEPKGGDEEGDTDRGVWLCYHVLGLVQHLPGFQPVPTKVKDYISFPKPNGYQSLHTALMLNGQSIEVQIRTSAMHQVAEYGMASHWAFYDEKKRAKRNDDPNSSSDDDSEQQQLQQHPVEDDYNTPWLSSIKEWQDEVLCSRDFVDCVRRELLGKRVFVFLRNGKILNLAKGATVIDAAFQIHTDVGLTMHGVEINGKPVPFSYELANGDVISVLTGKGGQPSTEWMRCATIRSTRSKLRSYFRDRQRKTHRDAGLVLFLGFCSEHARTIVRSSERKDAFQIPTCLEDVEGLFPGKSIVYDDVEDLLIDVGKRSMDSAVTSDDGDDVKEDDLDLLRKVVADVFLVPRSVLEEANGSRRVMDGSGNYLEMLDITGLRGRGGTIALEEKKDMVAISSPASSSSPSVASSSRTDDFKTTDTSSSSSSKGSDYKRIEIADPEYICSTCLPVLGDEIIGTRLVLGDKTSNINNRRDFATTTVHRCGCSLLPHKSLLNTSQYHPRQPSLSPAIAGSQSGSSDSSSNSDNNITRDNYGSRARSRLKMRLANKNGGILQIPGRSRGRTGSRTGGTPNGSRGQHELVKVKWDDSYISSGEEISFLAEVSVIADDRKLLLADCSEIVSTMTKIIKTGSLSTEEHAILEFLVKVDSLDHLQKVMNSLMGIQAVMSVERKFGSSL